MQVDRPADRSGGKAPIAEPDPVPTLLDPAGAFDAAWEERVRSLPAEARARLLATADRGRGWGEEGARVAAACYRALRDDLDPLDPAGADRLRWVLEHPPAFDPTWDAAFARTARGSVDEDLELEAAVLRGQFATQRGDLEEAEGAYRAVLARTRGGGRKAERAACANLARLCLDERREFEALALARRAASLMAAAGDAWGLALSRLYIGTVLRLLRDWERFRVALDGVEEMVPRLAGGARTRVVISLHGGRAALAIEEGRYAEAERDLDAIERLNVEGAPAGRTLSDRRQVPHFRAEARLRLGRPGEALRLLDLAETLGPTHDRTGLEVRLCRVRCFLATGEREAALLASRTLLDALGRSTTARGPARAGAGLRLELASALSRALVATVGDAPETERAHDLGAAAAIERIAELDRWVRDVPEMAAATPEDFAILEDHRRRSRGEQEAMLRAVARLLEPALREGRAPHPVLAGFGDLVCVCAWCQRVAAQGQAWLAVQAFLPLDGPLRVTHGMCPDCRARFLAEWPGGGGQSGSPQSTQGAQ